MEKRVIIALVLSLIVLIGYPFLFLENKKDSEKQTVEKKSSENILPDKTTEEKKSTGKETHYPISTTEVKEEILSIDTPLLNVKINTRGGVIIYWELKKFKDDKKEKNIVLFSNPNKELSAYPLSVSTPDQSLNQDLASGLYHSEGGTQVHLDAKHPKETILLSFFNPTTQKGIIKTITFYERSYSVDIAVEPIGFTDDWVLGSGSNFGIQSWGDQMVIGYSGPSTKVGTKVIQDKPSKIDIGKEVFHPQPIDWTALNDKYFIGAWIPKSAVKGAVTTKNKDKDIQTGLKLSKEGKSLLTLYAGPKEYEELKNLNIGLDKTIEFGWFMFGDWNAIRWIAKTLFHGLQILYEFTHNYGLSIILITVIIKIAFIPLTHKSYKSMKAMQNLQPEMQKLQKKYKDDKQKMNKELIELYKTHKVNPLGGCLPVLLQVPVFIGLFNLLYNTIELRQAHFFLWVQDLSIKDPFYILPIVMGITMFIQQKITPTTMDPRQAKIMLFLPILFTFFFLNFPSGLVLYWLVNNVLTITQQYITIKYLGTSKSPAIKNK